MSFQDPSIGGPLPRPAPREGLPAGERAPTERGQDPAREAVERGSSSLPSRPLTDEEREAAEQDSSRRPRAYAPHSERVPKPPTPGDAELVEHGLAGQMEEPHAIPAAPAATPPESARHPDAAPGRPVPSPGPGRELTIGAGIGALAAIAVGLGSLYRRWRRERNRPTNRLRRQARRVASGARRAGPVGGLGLRLLGIALLLARVLRARATPDRGADRSRGALSRRGSSAQEARPRPGADVFRP